MPSGAKKRKAAKRKDQEQRRLLGVHPPTPPPSLSGGPPRSSQGNAVREEEEEDVVNHNGKGMENGCEVTYPMEQDNHHKQNDTLRNEDKIEYDSTGLIDIVMDSTQNFGEEQPHESFLHQRTDEDAKEIEEVHVVATDVKKDEVLPSSPLDCIFHTTGEVSVSEVEAVLAEHVQSEKTEHVLVLGDGPSIIEHKKWEPVDTASTLSVSEEDGQAWGSLIQRCNSAENVAETSKNETEERVICLSDAAAEETDQIFKSHNGTKRHAVAGTTQVAGSSQLKQRTPWWSCCGLFDVLLLQTSIHKSGFQLWCARARVGRQPFQRFQKPSRVLFPRALLVWHLIVVPCTFRCAMLCGPMFSIPMLSWASSFVGILKAKGSLLNVMDLMQLE
ncbi:hypothetical protein Taro_026717 [Colocasia esculenta]|uniref:Uncharacterized protein n=1 Tax=Colocasia esculenta TaxID=4460 RepID=A0A843VG00_COLES|nr:hypothetical protein [Colocasia esculenta]